MAKYLITRLWQSALTFVLASIVVFVGIRQLPGDPAIAMAGEDATPQRVAALREQLGLDQPVVTQYFDFLTGFLRGAWGVSTRTGQPVTEMVATTLPVTVTLAVYAILLAVVAGIVLGTIAERYRSRWPEWAANGLALTFLSVPSFWLGLLAILLFAVQLQWFPSSGLDSSNPFTALYDLTLPALVLSTALAAAITRQTRSAMITTMKTDYVRTARAKGLSSARILVNYGLRNSLIVVITVIGLQLGGLISGAVVTEQVFGLPGFGKLVLNAVESRDYPVIQTVVLIITLAFIVLNLAVDILYSVVNPRVRVGGAPS
jgi:peptide/nickel transport system permease protein